MDYGTEAEYYTQEERALLKECTLCPRECRVNRFESAGGYCGTDAGMNIASVSVHKGEEPPISGQSGICNIFFTGCNLRCIYCQNHEISRPADMPDGSRSSLQDVLESVERILDGGIHAVGFVSPSHVIPQVKAIIRGLKERGRNPVIVFNTNSYDKRETLRGLEGMIDVYLPDYKYVTPDISLEYSGSTDYPEIAFMAIKEMYFQKGSSLRISDNGLAESGILLRHLVLPGHEEESKMVLRRLAEEISTGINISLMSQYYPVKFTEGHPLLGRPLFLEEYSLVVHEMESLGFRNGWIQDMESYRNYRPDFSKDDPFT